MSNRRSSEPDGSERQQSGGAKKSFEGDSTIDLTSAPSGSGVLFESQLYAKAKLGNKSNLFESAATIEGDGPVMRKIHEVVGANDGTFASLAFTSEKKIGIKSKSFMSSRRFSSRQRRRRERDPVLLQPKRIPNISQEDQAERLREIEDKTVKSRRERKFKMVLNLIESGEEIKRTLLQPLRISQQDEEHLETIGDIDLYISRGKTFGTQSNKPCQDCIAVTSWKNYECVTICDGHGSNGEEMAWQTANFISGIIMKNIVKYSVKNEGTAEAEIFEIATSEEEMKRMFKECDETAIWGDEMKNFGWVKIIGGEHEGYLGQIFDVVKASGEIIQKPRLSEHTGKGADEMLPVNVFVNGERRWFRPGRCGRPGAMNLEFQERQREIPVVQQLIPRKFLKCEMNFHGGTTCLVVVKNKATNQVRFATSGDSRVMILPGKQNSQFREDDIALNVVPKPFGLKMPLCSCLQPKPENVFGAPGILSVEHNIHDPRELNRLRNNFQGCYVIGDGKTNEGIPGYFYSNAMFPYTGGLTPTRGFGDRLYVGSGYTYEPEVSRVHVLSEGSLVIGGSDGVFDEAIWGKHMSGLSFEIDDLVKQKTEIPRMLSNLRADTARRCEAWDLVRVDDISLFCFTIGDLHNQKAN